MFEKPFGFRDTLPELYETKNNVRTAISQEMKAWGYQFIETPALEYYETVGKVSAILDQQLFKLLDPQGHTLVLRPDMTSPIARLAASKMLHYDLPLRLAYSGNVYRAPQREGGRPAEFEQIGVELVGDETVSSDGEVIALMISTLERTNISNFQILIGHIGFVHDLFLQILGTEDRVRILMNLLFEKNYVGYREHVSGLPLSSIDKKRLLDFLNLRGNDKVVESAISLIEDENSKTYLLQLRSLWETLEDYGVHHSIKFDLTLVSHLGYYTGILFEVYADKIGFPIGSGGRYDKLFEKFGKPSGATGFALRLDRLVESLGQLTEIKPSTCIFFSEEWRKEAFQIAKEKRAVGLYVVLQDINGVKQIDACKNQYDDIIFLIGKAGGRDSV